jgi:hypothetical protein
VTAVLAHDASTADFLDRLNRLSLTRSFTPQVDIDWAAQTTDAEYESLYPAWSLFVGSGLDAGLDAAARIRFVKYQQINLMLFTGLLERHAIGALAKLFDLDGRESFSEYVGHFIKEELYHHMMFQKAAGQIQATMPGALPLPAGRIDRALRWLFRFLRWLPGRRLRTTMTFTIFQFAERVTIQAHLMVQERIARPNCLIGQVWAFHALDEARHVAFDSLVLERSRLRWPVSWLPRFLIAPLCVGMSLLLNANEIWIGRQLGLRVRLWQLPRLMWRTQAPFKLKVFNLLSQILRGQAGGDQQ